MSFKVKNWIESLINKTTKLIWMRSTVLGTKPLPIHELSNKIFISAEKNIKLVLKN